MITPKAVLPAHPQCRSTRRGFTIVELLIVVVVIAILAAITIVSFNGVTRQAEVAAVESQIQDIRKKLEIYKIENGGYPRVAASFPEYKFTRALYDQTQNNIYYCLNRSTDSYSLGLRPKWDTSLGYIVTDSGVVKGVTVNQVATCAAVGETWGSANAFTVQAFAGIGGVWNTGWSWV